MIELQEGNLGIGVLDYQFNKWTKQVLGAINAKFVHLTMGYSVHFTTTRKGCAVEQL